MDLDGRIDNRVDGSNARCLFMDVQGTPTAMCVLKRSFHIDARGVIEPVPRLIRLMPDLHPELDGQASERLPRDDGEAPPGTDLIVVGHAHPAPGRPSTTQTVRVRVGARSFAVRALGPRYFEKRGDSIEASPPDRLEAVPLRYELAFGGSAIDEPGDQLADNPVGRGYAHDPNALLGHPAPQLEPGERDGFEGPAAFAPIAATWACRAKLGGTYDDAWAALRAPIAPKDRSLRYASRCHPALYSEAPLRSDEPIAVEGATRAGRWAFRLPRFDVLFSSKLGNARRAHASHLDTIVIDCDASVVELTWRAAIPLPRVPEQLERIRLQAVG